MNDCKTIFLEMENDNNRYLVQAHRCTPEHIDISIYQQHAGFLGSYVLVFYAADKKIAFTENAVSAYVRNIFRVSSDKLKAKYNAFLCNEQRLSKLAQIFESVEVSVNTGVCKERWTAINNKVNVFIKFNPKFYNAVFPQGCKGTPLQAAFYAYGLNIGGEMKSGLENMRIPEILA